MVALATDAVVNGRYYGLRLDPGKCTLLWFWHGRSEQTDLSGANGRGAADPIIVVIVIGTVTMINIISASALSVS